MPDLASVVAAIAVVLAHIAWAEEPTVRTESLHASDETATEINRKVTDPVSTTWSLKIQNNIVFLDIDQHGNQVQDTVVFQPTLPVWLTDDLKLIPRPKLTLLDAKPFTSNGDLRYAVGFGDTVLDLVLSPKFGPWLLGLGPTFVFPTASADRTGQGKWQAGPASVFGYRSPRWLAGIFEQQWWSFAGSSSRSTVSALNLQYLASYFFGDGWSIGTSPIIKVDWRASPGNRVTFPIGPSIGKVIKLGSDHVPVKFELEVLYVPVHPDKNGETLQIQLNVIPVIPGLVHGLMLSGSGRPTE
jgi:hypothetical protein